MPATTPTRSFDDRFSDPQAGALPWDEVRDRIAAAGTFWVTTVRADGRPHVTPLFAVWDDGALHFCTGPTEQKARNLEASRQVALTTGTSATDEGVDIVGARAPQTCPRRGSARAPVSELWAAKYGRGGALRGARRRLRARAGRHRQRLRRGTGQGAGLWKAYSHTSYRFTRGADQRSAPEADVVAAALLGLVHREVGAVRVSAARRPLRPRRPRCPARGHRRPPPLAAAPRPMVRTAPHRAPADVAGLGARGPRAAAANSSPPRRR